MCDNNKQRKRGYHFESKMPLRGEVVEQERNVSGAGGKKGKAENDLITFEFKMY